MAQRWHDLLFAHWPVPMEALRPAIPATLEIDTYEGQAWIGVVPFRMSGVRPRWVPSVPWLSAFPELNVRTYVRDRSPTPSGALSKPGVFFFSLDAGNPVAVAIARSVFHLPYFHARMAANRQGDAIHYTSQRLHSEASPAEWHGRYWPTGTVFHAEPGSLAHWLTERYSLYTTDRHARIYRCEIHPPPWPLQPAAAEIARDTMTQPPGIVRPDVPPLLHFSRLQEVIVWPLERLER